MDIHSSEEDIFKFLVHKRGYLKNLKRVARKFNVPEEVVRRASKRARKHIKESYKPGSKPKSPVDNMVVKSAWQGGKDGELRYSYEREKDSNDINFEELRADIVQGLSSKIKPWSFKKSSNTNNKKGLFLFTSDKHVGAYTNEQSIYQNPYDEGVFRDRMFKLLEECQYQYKMHGRFDTIAFLDLGDPLDGYNAQTTRGGHHLPQNMSNREQFDVYVRVHRLFFDALVKMDITDNIKFVAVTSDNHSGAFGYCANRAVDIYLELKYPEVDRMIIDKFMNHFEYGNHTYIISHGKDEEDMRSGLPLRITPQVENYINDYINIKEIDSKYIHFVKGDLHQSSVEYAKRFRYKNVMSMYGSSKWIHTNYGSGTSGVDFEVVEKHNSRISQDRILFE